MRHGTDIRKPGSCCKLRVCKLVDEALRTLVRNDTASSIETGYQSKTPIKSASLSTMNTNKIVGGTPRF